MRERQLAPAPQHISASAEEDRFQTSRGQVTRLRQFTFMLVMLTPAPCFSGVFTYRTRPYSPLTRQGQSPLTRVEPGSLPIPHSASLATPFPAPSRLDLSRSRSEYVHSPLAPGLRLAQCQNMHGTFNRYIGVYKATGHEAS